MMPGDKYGPALGGISFWVLIFTALIILFIFLYSIPAAKAADGGFFNCFELSPEDKTWFQQQPMKTCCDLGDGMPVPYEHRSDGYYIPAFDAPRMCEAQDSEELKRQLYDKPKWIRVPGEVVKYVKNPIGWAVVWWTDAKLRAPEIAHSVRCFIPMAEF